MLPVTPVNYPIVCLPENEVYKKLVVEPTNADAVLACDKVNLFGA